MFETTALDFLPLWAIFILSTVLIVLAMEVGFATGQRKLRHLKDGETIHLGGAVAATLGLLAFILAFTFGTGTNRWDVKKELILNESNAISTAFLRADMLPEPQRARIQQLLSRYVDHRIAINNKDQIYKTSHNPRDFADKLEIKISEAKIIQSDLWVEAVAAAKRQPTPITGLFVSALNDVFDLHQSRVTVIMQQRMPMVFWITLYGLAILAMWLGGYDVGVSRGGRALSSWVVALAFSSIMLLVIALDRPQASAVNQAPLLEVQRDMHAALADSDKSG